MKKLLVVVIALAFVAGAAYAAVDANKVVGKSVDKGADSMKTMVTSAGQTVVNAAEGTVNTANVVENNPVTTAVQTTGQAAEETIKTATFQKVDKKAAKNTWNNK